MIAAQPKSFDGGLIRYLTDGLTELVRADGLTPEQIREAFSDAKEFHTALRNGDSTAFSRLYSWQREKYGNGTGRDSTSQEAIYLTLRNIFIYLDGTDEELRTQLLAELRTGLGINQQNL